jgi:acyl-CoA synthetase (AMP-forming)/AMP-acid ligase II
VLAFNAGGLSLAGNPCAFPAPAVWSITSNVASPSAGGIGDLWMDQQYVDFSDPTIRSRFYSDGWVYLGFFGDVITSGVYRICPAEIEDALVRHPAVVIAAAIGVPDAVRTESIKAFVIVKDGFPAGPQLAEDIRNFVREHLAKHEVPREIEFVETLPMTNTGKIQRRKLRDAERAKLASG